MKHFKYTENVEVSAFLKKWGIADLQYLLS